MILPNSLVLIAVGYIIGQAYHRITMHQELHKELTSRHTDLATAVSTSHLSDVVVSVKPIAPIPQISQKTGNVMPQLQQYDITTSSGFNFTSAAKPRVGVALNQF